MSDCGGDAEEAGHAHFGTCVRHSLLWLSGSTEVDKDGWYGLYSRDNHLREEHDIAGVDFHA